MNLRKKRNYLPNSNKNINFAPVFGSICYKNTHRTLKIVNLQT